MDNIYLSFSNRLLPLSGSNACKPGSYEYYSSKGPLNLGFAIYAPVSSVQGSASFLFFQPLLTGKVFASAGVLIAAQLFLFFADRFFGLESMPVQKGPVISPEQTVRMTLSNLQDFLASTTHDNALPSSGVSAPTTGQEVTGISVETQEIPLVFSLTVSGEYTDKPFCPSIFFNLPLFSLPGVRGALPLLILELLTTIFVRTVVPPETTGSKPLPE